MAVRSETGRGRIYAGETPLTCSIAVVQTGPMQLTVKVGSFSTTGDRQAGIASETYVLASDVVLDLEPDPSMVKTCTVELVASPLGAADVALLTRLDGRYPPLPDGWQTVQVLVFDFKLEPGAAELPDVFVFSVLPGFPAGTTAADWQVQMGGT